MKAKYPAFLSKNPTFLGLGFIDLIIVGVGLVLSLTFGMNSLLGTGLTIIMIGINKLLGKYVDFKGLFFGSRTRELDWMDSAKEEEI